MVVFHACSSFAPQSYAPLPKDPLKHVFSFLRISDFPSVFCTTLYWRQVALSDYIWQRIALRDFEITGPKPQEYRSWYEYVKTRIQLRKTLRNNTYSERMFPEIVDHFSLLSLTDDTLCYATGSRKRIKSWPVAGGPPESLLRRPTSPALVEASKGKLVVVGTRYLRQVDIATKSQTSCVALEHLSSVQPIVYTKRYGDKLFLGAQKGILGVWNTTTGRRECLYLGLSSSITHLDYSRHYVAAVSQDGLVIVWDESGRACCNKYLDTCSRLFLYNHMLIIINSQSMITFYDIRKNIEIGTTATIQRTHIGKGLQPLVQIVKNFGIISETGLSIDVWDLEKLEKIQILTSHSSPLSHFALSENTFFTGSNAGDIAVWDVTDAGLVLKQQYLVHTQAVRKIVALDIDLVLSYGDDEKAHIWNRSSGELLQTFTLKNFDLIDVLYSKGRLLFVSGNHLVAAITFASSTSTTTSPRLSFRL